MLHLDRPIVVFDLEATGTNPSDARVIQVAMRRLESGDDGIEQTGDLTTLVDPGIPIPQSVTELTGISNIDVQGAPYFTGITKDINALIEDADLAGFNALAYDFPLLKSEYDRLGEILPGPDDRQILDVYRLEQALVSRTLSALYTKYTGKSLDDAHDAEADVEATMKVLNGQLREHQPDARTPEALADLVRGDYLDDHRKLKRTDNGKVEICFGKHSGKTLTEVNAQNPGYIDWIRREIPELASHIDDALGIES